MKKCLVECKWIEYHSIDVEVTVEDNTDDIDVITKALTIAQDMPSDETFNSEDFEPDMCDITEEEKIS